jgi:Na+/H+-dicarboxylate symporter
METYPRRRAFRRTPAVGQAPLPLYVRVLIGVVLGATLGVAFGKEPYPLLGLRNEDLGTLGMLVIKLLRALAVPLVLFAILDAFAKTNIRARQGGRLILICLVNVSVAMLIGLTIMNTLRPGDRWRGQLDEIRTAVQPKEITAKKSDDPTRPARPSPCCPTSNTTSQKPDPAAVLQQHHLGRADGAVHRVRPCGACASGKRRRGDAGGVLAVERFIEGTYQILIQMLEWVVLAVPFAVFGVVAQVVGAAGLGVFQFLWVFLAIVCSAWPCTASFTIRWSRGWSGRKSPRVYLGRGADAIFTGLSTNSSLATVPVTLRCLDRMNVSPASARLAALVGTNLNNDGITLYEAMAALFLAQAVGMNLGLNQQFVVVLASIMAGAGVAGIPEAGLIVLPLVLAAAGLPEATVALALPLLLPVDWIIARARSGVNVMSDMLVAILLDRSAETR